MFYTHVSNHTSGQSCQTHGSHICLVSKILGHLEVRLGNVDVIVCSQFPFGITYYHLLEPENLTISSGHWP